MNDQPIVIYEYPKQWRTGNQQGFFFADTRTHSTYTRYLRRHYRMLRTVAGLGPFEARAMMLDLMQAGRLFIRRPRPEWMLS